MNVLLPFTLTCSPFLRNTGRDIAEGAEVGLGDQEKSEIWQNQEENEIPEAWNSASRDLMKEWTSPNSIEVGVEEQEV